MYAGIIMFKRLSVFAARRKRPATSVVRPQAEYETSLPPAINRIVKPPHSSIPIGHLWLTNCYSLLEQKPSYQQIFIKLSANMKVITSAIDVVNVCILDALVLMRSTRFSVANCDGGVWNSVFVRRRHCFQSWRPHVHRLQTTLNVVAILIAKRE